MVLLCFDLLIDIVDARNLMAASREPANLTQTRAAQGAMPEDYDPNA